MQITKKDFADYVCGWLTINPSDPDFQDVQIGNMRAALRNAEAMLDDWQDGIEAELERKAENNQVK